MAEWLVESESEFETKANNKLGKDEWERRKKVCAEKRDELEKKFGWEERCIVGCQFDVIARHASTKVWARLIKKPVDFWRDLVYKLADK